MKYNIGRRLGVEGEEWKVGSRGEKCKVGSKR
jgi:hypothetical protein